MSYNNTNNNNNINSTNGHSLSSNQSNSSSYNYGPNNPVPNATYSFDPNHWVSFTSSPEIINTLPLGSRLFLGNLACERVDKSQLATIFSKYGNIVEILTKGSFGFVQYDSPDACVKAINNEQNRNLGGLTLDLKVSKVRPSLPKVRQQNGFQSNSSGQRYNDNNGFNNKRQRNGNFDNDNNRKRSNYGINDNYRNNNFDNNNINNNNSNNNYNNNNNNNNNYNNLNNNSLNDGLPKGKLSHLPLGSGTFPLKLRYGKNVPEVQIIVIGDVDRGFVSNVENVLHNGFNADTLILTKGLSVADVEQQCETEGVLFIALLEPAGNHSSEPRLVLHQIKGNGEIYEYDNVGIDLISSIIIRDITLGKQKLENSKAAYRISKNMNNNNNNNINNSMNNNLRNNMNNGLSNNLNNLNTNLNNNAINNTTNSQQTYSSNLNAAAITALLKHQQQQQQQQQQPQNLASNQNASLSALSALLGSVNSTNQNINGTLSSSTPTTPIAPSQPSNTAALSYLTAYLQSQRNSK